ncbi:hypothetical protein MHM98_16155 [Psychrobium sp. MM17-31]|uniref:hypothetical protein n=1 Tax=Psychrobium sp. MM17-31 TaxID=2917758 RepID=UPI001EF5425C|nr:hypothetical protein [Psychrobium sp. MM17-31]MCG7532865.1 hypothetical protein [Psychrobium sp. MM17-31]
MFDLFKNELKRFGKLALIICVISIGYWLYHSLTMPIVETTKNKVFFTNVWVMVCSLGFGILQMALHRRKAHWTYLVHRPIGVKNIHLALSGAAAVMLFVALVLPIFVVTMGYDLGSNLVIESRHYLRPVQLFLVALVSYFIGSFIVLSPHKIAFLSLSWLVFAFSSNDIVSNEVLFGVCLLSLAIVFTLARLSFKEDLSAQLSNKPAVIFSVLALQPGLTAMLMASQLVHYHLPMMMFDAHPDQYTVEQQEGYYSQVWRMKPSELIEKFVDDNNAQKSQLVKRSENAEVQWVRSRFMPQPFVGQAHHHDRQFALTDKANQAIWVFSHNLGVLVGTHQLTDEKLGYIGARGFLAPESNITPDDVFNGVPSVLFDQFIQTRNAIYVIDFQQKEMELKHQLGDDEIYLSTLAPGETHDFYAIASNKKLYLFNTANFEEANDYSEPAVELKHPFSYNNSTTIRYTDLIDGYLIEYKSSVLFGFNRPGIGLAFIDHLGKVDVLAHHEFKGYRALPQWVADQDYWFSPIIVGTLYAQLDNLRYPSRPEGGLQMKDALSMVYAQSTYIVALVAALFSALVTFVLAIKIKLSTSNTIMWTVLNLICALPGLIAFLFMTNWRESLYAAKHQPNN